VQNGDPNVAVIGDLNDFPNTPPIDALTKGTTPGSSLRAVVTEANPPYTYVFSGQSEILDHILLTSGLAALFTGVEVAHFDADYPEQLSKDATKPNRESDHDPPVARFKWSYPGLVDRSMLGHLTDACPPPFVFHR
jgi:predicted extracellular nuclease